MRELERSLYRSERKKQATLMISYIVNIVLTTVFLMISTGISNTVNESLNPNDYEQFIAILFSIISVCVVTILFFQWVISMLFTSLYESRRTFNINMRLAGLSKRSLFMIYFNELARMQILAVPVGLAVSWFSYSFIARILGLPSVQLNMTSIIGAVVIHSVAIITSVSLSFSKSNRLSPVDMLRGKARDYTRFKWSVKRTVKTIVGTAILVISFALPEYIESVNTWPLRFLLIISYAFLHDVLFLIMNNLLILLNRIFKTGKIHLTRTLSECSYSRSKVLTNMIVFSVVLTIGLQSVYLSTRLAAADVSKNNIHYEAVAIFEEPFLVPDEQIASKDLYTLKFVAGSTASGRIRMQGVNSTYVEQYETIHFDNSLSDFNNEDLIPCIDDEKWNGVIFPQSFISPKDIGQIFTATIHGQLIDFQIVAGYYTNNFSELRCIVGNAFLANALEMQGYANTVFSLEGFPVHDFYSAATIQSNDDLAQMSYDKVVSSTELVELSANIVLVCALIMLMNYVYFISNERRLDYIKLRAMGMSSMSAKNVFILHILQTVAFAIIISVPLVGIFSETVCNIMMYPYYYPNGITFPYPLLILEVVVLLLLPAMFFAISMRSVNSQMVNLLRSITEN